MGFFEDDRIRHKNRYLNQPSVATHMTEPKLNLQLSSEAQIEEVVRVLSDAGFDIHLDEDKKSIVVSKPA